MPGATSSFLLLRAMSIVTSNYLLLVVTHAMHGQPDLEADQSVRGVGQTRPPCLSAPHRSECFWSHLGAFGGGHLIFRFRLLQSLNKNGCVVRTGQQELLFFTCIVRASVVQLVVTRLTGRSRYSRKSIESCCLVVDQRCMRSGCHHVSSPRTAVCGFHCSSVHKGGPVGSY